MNLLPIRIDDTLRVFLKQRQRQRIEYPGLVSVPVRIVPWKQTIAKFKQEFAILLDED